MSTTILVRKKLKNVTKALTYLMKLTDCLFVLLISFTVITQA
jgi:hypothetical protein